MSETKGLFEKVAKTIELFFVIAGAAIAFFVYRDTKDQVLIAKAELSEARSQDSITNLQFLQQLQVSQIRDSLSNVSTQKSLDLSEKSFNISALALKNAELRSKRDQENFILIRKADVSLDSIMPSVENDTSVLIVLQFYNHGETQALDCKFSFATKVVDNLKNICDFDSSKLDIYPLGEEIPSHMTWVAPLKFNLDSNLVTPFLNGKKIICFVGQLIYKDIFGKMHVTKFFYVGSLLEGMRAWCPEMQGRW